MEDKVAVYVQGRYTPEIELERYSKLRMDFDQAHERPVAGENRPEGG